MPADELNAIFDKLMGGKNKKIAELEKEVKRLRNKKNWQLIGYINKQKRMTKK